LSNTSRPETFGMALVYCLTDKDNALPGYGVQDKEIGYHQKCKNPNNLRLPMTTKSVLEPG